MQEHRIDVLLRQYDELKKKGGCEVLRHGHSEADGERPGEAGARELWSDRGGVARGIYAGTDGRAENRCREGVKQIGAELGRRPELRELFAVLLSIPKQQVAELIPGVVNLLKKGEHEEDAQSGKGNH